MSASRRCVVLVGLLVFLSPMSWESVGAAPHESQVPAPNPDLVASCGLDIDMILDESGSVGSSAGDVRTAFRAFTGALKNTGSRMAVSDFSTVAHLQVPTYTEVTDDTISSVFDPYISHGYNPSGSTDWEDAFRVARYFLPRPDPARAHLTVFITDGDPNVVIREDRVTYDPGNPNVSQNEYELKEPLSSDETQSADENAAKDRAVSNANAIKATGSHILTVAVGSGLNSQSSLNRIIAVSGPDVYSGSGTFDISTDDIYRVPDFSKLADALRDAAFQLCAPSVTVRKMLDMTPDPGTNDLVPGTGWGMTAHVAPDPKQWVLPPSGSGDTASTTTDDAGFAGFQWTTVNPVGSHVSITEEDPGGVPPGFANDPSATRCTYQTPDQPSDQPLHVHATNGAFTTNVPFEAIVTCQMVNRLPPDPDIDLLKETNGVDADDPPGPRIPVGARVHWTYVVTNTGNDTLSAIDVTDDHGIHVTCPADTLAPGASETCTADGRSRSGQYANTGSVRATDAFGTHVSDADPSHYVGSRAGIHIEKSTNGKDADHLPGPYLSVGDPVTWRYVVTNTGTVPLSNVSVVDDKGVTPVFVGGDTNGNTLLDPPETWTYQATGVAVAGQYENVGTATGTNETTGRKVRDSDASHYFAEDPSIDVEKSTNGKDADAAPGPKITVGHLVAWTYRITNTGNVPLRWSVADDQVAVHACPRIRILLPGRSTFCFASGKAHAGQYANIGSATGVAPSGTVVTDTDPSHYFGVEGAIALQKQTNGEDAEEAPGVFVPPGAPVTWTYVVTNTGNDTLTGVDVQDDRGVSISCPKTVLDPGESMTCTAAGNAQTDQYTNSATATGQTTTGQRVQADDTSNYFGTTPGIHLEKLTNGLEAADAPGPFVPVGDPVEWTYEVTNTGNAQLTDVTVTDDQGVAVTCPKTVLDPDETMSCTASGTAVAGQYENTATAVGRDPSDDEVSSDDTSHYFGAVSKVELQKLTNGVDADEAPGPAIAVGDEVTWTYLVSNPGNVAITDIEVTDDQGVKPSFQGGDGDSDGELDPGETWTYEASGVAQAGQYANVATVTGMDVIEHVKSATDPSHYVGQGTPSGGVDTGAGRGGGSSPWLPLILGAMSLLLAGRAMASDYRGRHARVLAWRRRRGAHAAPTGLGTRVGMAGVAFLVAVTAAALTANAPRGGAGLGGPAIQAAVGAGHQRSTGMRLLIPTIGVDASVVGLGLNPDGTLEVPTSYHTTGWWRGGTRPGDSGPAVIVGHVDSKSGPAVFYRLSSLRAGDAVSVIQPDGSAAGYVVTGSAEYPKVSFPTESVYGTIPYAGLRLITCGGPFDRATGHYLDNIIVYARAATV